MGIGKKILNTQPVCKVTFHIPEQMGVGARQAQAVCEFNNWLPSATPMKRLKTAAFSTTVDLETGRSYQFRYLLEPSRWKTNPMRTNIRQPSVATATIR